MYYIYSISSVSLGLQEKRPNSHQKITMRPIRFKGSSSVFSNFYPHWIEDKELGLMFFSVEQGYQHQCALFNGFDNVAEEILSVKPEHDVGRKCKMIAKKITAKRKSWGATKEAILLDLLTLKLCQHEPFRKALLATDRPLLHTVASDYWGLGRHGEGANRCGELLMKLRQSVQSSWGAPHNQVLVYTDSIFKYLPTQIEEVGFCVKALPGASVGGKKNLTALVPFHLCRLSQQCECQQIMVVPWMCVNCLHLLKK